MRTDRRSLFVFLAAWLFYSGYFATNVVREHYPAFSLAERGTLRVDPYLGLHDDIFMLDGRGAFINNNPGASMLAAVPYFLTRPFIDRVVERVAARRAASGEAPATAYDHSREDYRQYFQEVRRLGLDVRFGLAAGVTTTLLMAPLGALSILVMWAVLRRMELPERYCLPLALLYGFGTPVFFRTAFLNQNLLVAHFAFFSFALLLGRKVSRPGFAAASAAGFFAGLALLCDYSAIGAVAVLGLYCLYRCTRVASAGKRDEGAPSAPPAKPRDFFPFAVMVAAALIPIGVLLAYQAWAFGSPIWPAQHYMPPAEYGAQGWNGFTGVDPALLYANLFDLRFGLVPAAPVLLIALGALARRRSRVPRLGTPELVLSASMFVYFWLFCSATQFARLQWETGVRYLVPVVPFVFVPAAAVLAALPRATSAAIASLAVFQSWSLAMVREDPLSSMTTVLALGPRLPWLTTLERMGEQYGAVATALAANPTLVVVALAIIPAALLSRAFAPPTRG